MAWPPVSNVRGLANIGPVANAVGRSACARRACETTRWRRMPGEVFDGKQQFKQRRVVAVSTPGWATCPMSENGGPFIDGLSLVGPSGLLRMCMGTTVQMSRASQMAVASHRMASSRSTKPEVGSSSLNSTEILAARIAMPSPKDVVGFCVVDLRGWAELQADLVVEDPPYGLVVNGCMLDPISGPFVELMHRSHRILSSTTPRPKFTIRRTYSYVARPRDDEHDGRLASVLLGERAVGKPLWWCRAVQRRGSSHRCSCTLYFA